jgi:hypothetical protein
MDDCMEEAEIPEVGVDAAADEAHKKGRAASIGRPG